MFYQTKSTKAEAELSNVQMALLEIETKFKETSRMLQEQRQANSSLITQVTDLQSQLRNIDETKKNLHDSYKILKQVEAERNSFGNEVHALRRGYSEL